MCGNLCLASLYEYFHVVGLIFMIRILCFKSIRKYENTEQFSTVSFSVCETIFFAFVATVELYC